MEMAILVPVTGQPIATRLDSFEEQLISQLHARSGLSRSEVIRRCVRLVRLEIARSGSPDFLFAMERPFLTSRQKPSTAGRKPRRQKISELEKSIHEHLRAAESQRKQLELLKGKVAA